jgi:hypothetical protein
MKKIFFLTFIVFLSASSLFAQDVITKKTGEDIQAKVLEIGLTEVRYKNFDNQGGPTIVILKSDILIIRYENGTKDIFKEDSTANPEELYMKGQKDASRYYKKYEPAATGTLIPSIISPIVGLIPAIACSSTQPKMTNLAYPDESLMKKPPYFNGYTERARKIKKRKVWNNWLIGLVSNVVIIILLTSGNGQ